MAADGWHGRGDPAGGDVVARAASVDITPVRPIPLAGSADRREPYREVHDPLEANILLLSGGGGPAVALVAVDLLYAGELTATVAGWGRAAGVSVHFAASHTHYGPATDLGLAPLGEVDRGWLDGASGDICRAIEELRRASVKEGADRVSVDRAHSGYATRRRRRGVRIVRDGRRPRLYSGIINAPDRRRPAEDAIAVIGIGDPADPVAVIWSLGCHPTAAPWSDSVSAEFPGEVRRVLRERYPGLPVLFLQGGAGDVRPSVTRPEGLERWRLELQGCATGRAPWRRPDTAEWRAWASRLAVAVDGAAFRGPPRPLRSEVRRAAAEVGSLRRSDGSPVVLEGGALRLADGLQLVGFNVELMNDHPQRLAAALGGGDAVVYGYADRVFGYWPTTAMVPEGGYEVDLHHPSFRISGRPPPDPDAVIEGLCRGLASPRPVSGGPG